MKVITPNVLNSKLKTAIISAENSEITEFLEKEGINLIPVFNKDILPKYERGHADMRALHLGSKDIICYKEEEEIINELKSRGFNPILTESKQEGDYPKSAGLNALVIGNIIVLNKKCADIRLLEYAQNNGFELIFTRQGYARCSSCIVSEKAVITADKSVYNALKDKLDVLLISEGNILLCDTKDGMIGGASFMIDKNTIFFCGDLTKHPDYINISNFLKKHSVKAVFPKNIPLTDIGSAVLLECQ